MEFAMPPPVLADRRGNVGEEGEVERTCALVDEVEEDRDQRNDDDDGRENRQTADEVVGRSAASVVHAHRLRLEVHRTWLVVEGLGAHVSAPSPERRV